MSKKAKELQNAIVVQAQIEVGQDAQALVSTTIATEQQIMLGRNAVTVLMNEKREQFAEALCAVGMRVNGLSKQTEEARTVYNEALEAGKKAIEKRLKPALRKTYAEMRAIATAMIAGKYDKVVPVIDEDDSDDDDDDKMPLLIEVCADDEEEAFAVSVEISTYGSNLTLTRTQAPFDSKTATAFSKLHAAEAQQEQAVEYSSGIQQSISDLDQFERRLETNLAKSALTNSEDGKAILAALRSVASPSLPAMPWQQ